MLWRVYVALHAAVVALALGVGATWVLRMRWDLDRWPSVGALVAVTVGSAVLAFLWMQRPPTEQLRTRAWRSLRFQFLALGAAAAFFAVTDVTNLLSAGTPAYLPESAVRAEVVRVIDGDTIVARVDGREQRVRYIGIDSPETNHPTRGVEPYGIEASALNQSLVGGKDVWLEKDVSETDAYGRLLRYVWLAEGHMVNVVMVEEGYARADTWPPDVRFQTEFARAEQEARAQRRGLWVGR